MIALTVLMLWMQHVVLLLFILRTSQFAMRIVNLKKKIKRIIDLLEPNALFQKDDNG